MSDDAALFAGGRLLSVREGASRAALLGQVLRVACLKQASCIEARLKDLRAATSPVDTCTGHSLGHVPEAGYRESNFGSCASATSAVPIADGRRFNGVHVATRCPTPSSDDMTRVDEESEKCTEWRPRATANSKRRSFKYAARRPPTTCEHGPRVRRVPKGGRGPHIANLAELPPTVQGRFCAAQRSWAGWKCSTSWGAREGDGLTIPARSSPAEGSRFCATQRTGSGWKFGEGSGVRFSGGDYCEEGGVACSEHAGPGRPRIDRLGAVVEKVRVRLVPSAPRANDEQYKCAATADVQPTSERGVCRVPTAPRAGTIFNLRPAPRAAPTCPPTACAHRRLTNGGRDCDVPTTPRAGTESFSDGLEGGRAKVPTAPRAGTIFNLRPAPRAAPTGWKCREGMTSAPRAGDGQYKCATQRSGGWTGRKEVTSAPRADDEQNKCATWLPPTTKARRQPKGKEKGEHEGTDGVCVVMPGLSSVPLGKQEPECGQGMKSRRRRRRRGLWQLAFDQRYDLEVFRSATQSQSGNNGDASGAEGAVQEGELDSVVAATLQRDVMEAWDVPLARDVARVFEVLDGDAVYEGLFVDRSKLVSLPGKKSALTGQQVRNLEQAGVLERKHRADPRVRNVVKAFTVPKPSGKLRLVVDASGVGEAQQDPPHVELPSVSDVKGLVASYSYVTQLDGKSWFYQVPSRQLRAYFALRTVIGVFWLVVLPMGWSWSVWIAQTLAVAIGQRALSKLPAHVLPEVSHVAYVDNFIACGRTEEATTALVDRLRGAATECGAVFKGDSSDDRPRSREEILGMLCDFHQKTVRLKPSWVVQFTEIARRFLLTPGRHSLRQVWQLLGNILWGMRVLGLRLLSYPYIRLWMSRQAKRLATGAASWGDRGHWWPSALRDLRQLSRQIEENRAVDVRPRAPAEAHDVIWADASMRGGAYILEDTGVSESFAWSARWAANRIHVLEAEAMRRGVARWVKDRRGSEVRGARLMTDNLLVFWGLSRGKARGVLFSRVLESMCTALQDVDWTVEWVPTAEQKADYLSRCF